MLRLLFLCVIILPKLICAQTGPHNSANQVPFVLFSDDNARFVTATYTDIAFWNSASGKIIWHKTFAQLGLGSSVDILFNFKISPNLKYIYVKGNPGNFLMNTETMEVKAVVQTIDFISSYGTGIYTDVNKKKSHTTDFNTWEECKGIGSGSLSADGKKLLEYISDKKHKSYDLATKKAETIKGDMWSAIRKPKYAGGSFIADLNYVPAAEIILKDKEGRELKKFAPKYGGFGQDQFKIIAYIPDSACIFTHEQKYFRKTNETLYKDYIMCYSVPDGNVIRETELSSSDEKGEEEAKKQELERQARQKEEYEKRKKLIENAKPGYAAFDAQFTDLSIPYTFSYDALKGFELVGWDFLNPAIIPQSTSVIYGIGRICECNDSKSYLIMIRDKTPSNEHSSFIILSYGLDGSIIGNRNIGTTQKDPSGIITLELSISGSGCGMDIKSKMVYPNGHTEDKSTRIGGCKVISN
jgi:hypothetical protein